MSDQPSPEQPEAQPADTPAENSIEEWKPEPRKWVWKDLFTAPMLAFKPKCMIIAVVTLFVLYLFNWGYFSLLSVGVGERNTLSGIAIIGPLLTVLGLLINLIVFSLGATLIATFMKADLLDDEFLSLGEAIGQYKKRIGAAIMVPSFLVATGFGFVALIYVAMLVGSIPYAGSILYALLYPLGFILGLLTILILIAISLSVFVFPSIIAIRKHSWFDNVIDTFEAVGTKPHVVVLNIALTKLIIYIAGFIAVSGMLILFAVSSSSSLPGNEVIFAELASWQWAFKLDFAGMVFPSGGGQIVPGYYHYFTGLIVGIWKAIFLLLILGYLMNLYIGSGMLTYLAVREDDYWDDEDLEDLDKLAKELEEEAKAEEARMAAEAAKESAEPAKDEPKAEETPAEEAPAEEAPAEEPSEAEAPAEESSEEAKPEEGEGETKEEDKKD